MVCADVRRLMRHHSGQLRFLVRRQNQARVHIEKAAGQRHRVDLVGINHLDRERHLAVGVLHNVLADAVYILHNHWIGDETRALLDLVGVLLAHLDLAVGRVPVAQAAFADFAIADGAHVRNAARLHFLHLAAGINHLVGIDLHIAGIGDWSGPGLWIILSSAIVFLCLFLLV